MSLKSGCSRACGYMQVSMTHSAYSAQRNTHAQQANLLRLVVAQRRHERAERLEKVELAIEEASLPSRFREDVISR